MDTKTQLDDTYIKSIPHLRPGYSVVKGDMSGYIGRVIVTIESACIQEIESVGIRTSAWFDFDNQKYIKPRDNAILSVAKKSARFQVVVYAGRHHVSASTAQFDLIT